MCLCVPDRIRFWKCWFFRRGETGLPKESHIGGRQTPSPLHQPCYFFRIGQNFQNELPVKRSILAKFAAYQLNATGSRFNACSFIKMLFFCQDMLYRLCKQYDHVIMFSKNQSAHSSGINLHLINLNICK